MFGYLKKILSDSCFKSIFKMYFKKESALTWHLVNCLNVMTSYDLVVE